MPACKDKAKGTWYASFYYEDWTGKKVKKMKRGFPTKREALEWERTFLQQQTADLEMTFENFVAVYVADMKGRIKENTWGTKEHILYKKLVPYFGKRKMCDIHSKEVIAWQNEMLGYRDKNGKPYSPVYLKTLHNQLSAVFNHAVRHYNLKVNPAAQAGNMGKPKGREMLFWTKAEYLKFAEAMMDKPLSYYAFEMLYWCGVREGELLALTPGDFDFEKQTVTISKSYQRIKGKDVITDPKTPKSNRVIQMPAFLCEEMRDYIKSLYGVKPTDRIFTVTKSYLHREMDRGAKEAGVKRIRIHDLRHPYVKHTTKIFSLRLKFFQAQPVPDALRKTRGAFLHLREGGSHNPFLRSCNKKLSSLSIPQSKMSLILYAISMRLSGYTSTLSMRRSVSSAVRSSELKTALAASCRLSCRTCSSCFCFACANTTA